MSRFAETTPDIEEAEPLSSVNTADSSRVISGNETSSSTSSSSAWTSAKKIAGFTGIATTMMLFGVNGFTSAGNDAIQAASTKRIQQKTTSGRDGRIATTIVRHDDNAKTKSLGEIPLTASSYDAIRDMVMKDEEKSKLTAKSKKRGGCVFLVRFGSFAHVNSFEKRAQRRHKFSKFSPAV